MHETDDTGAGRHYSAKVKSSLLSQTLIAGLGKKYFKLCVCVCLSIQLLALVTDTPLVTHQVILVGPSLEETLQAASNKLGEEVVVLQSVKGATIDDVSLLR